ncbi:LacI family DNA-binding transcriptional regulator [Saccharibacillus sp. CPCC 101409]|uniref:LacI family DNA-binding transcriptional regulator n=1 Tax=Saccharibacillus sp. CPCC 101409 TaxID=3058041 RepID=UPI002671D993|nr:LacI family DNA-binding transcriptional regulator [Saccharibacillus sp. CPCC 101409]MDO3412572.1 LacI family DNA-binding transcriptional regulator [Saccharibacillus sp. CPCC 101409]
MAKKVTMQQIADQLGVSKFVVSKALSGKGGVSEATRERVIRAASQLGYFTQPRGYGQAARRIPDPARTRDPGRQSVLVLMPNVRFQTPESLYWGRILNGVTEALEEQGLGIVIVSEQRIDAVTSVLNPDGILGLIGIGEISTPLLLDVHRLGLPTVLIDHEDPLVPADTVFAGNVDASMRLTNHLIGCGHRRLHFLGSAGFSRSFRDRWSGFRAALESRGLRVQGGSDPMNHLAGIDGAAYEPELRQWLAKRRRQHALPTALVCANDDVALVAARSLASLGLRVPEDVSLTGFDNIDAAGGTADSPALTTVHVPKEAMGRRAALRLLERIRDPKAPLEKILLSSDLVLRSSVAELPPERISAEQSGYAEADGEDEAGSPAESRGDTGTRGV